MNEQHTLPLTPENLSRLASKFGWKARPLSYEDVMRMGAAELRFHESHNATVLNAAIASSKNPKTKWSE
jgi:hypothetical protein